MIDKSAYLLRISQASPAGLVVINFEIIIEYLNQAIQSENQDAFRAAVQKAKEALEQLIQSLDFDIPVSHVFYDIYSYSYKLLCDVRFSSDTQAACAVLKEVNELMEMLLVGWRDTAQKADAEALELGEKPGNAPKIYTGLTYGRDGTAIEYIDEGKDRSYMA